MYLYAWTCMFAGNMFPLQKQLDNNEIQQVNTHVNTYNKYIGICNSVLAYSPSLVISSWWKFTDFIDSNRPCVAKRQGLQDPQDSQAPHTSAMVPDHSTEVREKWSRKWGATSTGAVVRCVVYCMSFSNVGFLVFLHCTVLLENGIWVNLGRVLLVAKKHVQIGIFWRGIGIYCISFPVAKGFCSASVNLEQFRSGSP